MLESSSSNNTTASTSTINHSNSSHVKRNNKENQTLADAMTIPISSLSNQNNSNSNLVNSVIQQTNQQSVIQSAAGGSTHSTVQLPKSIILFNKINQSSVIQSTENEILQNNRMDQTSDNNNDNNNNTNVICSTTDDDSKRRREMLNRRPSYRKILNEISSADTASILDAAASERTNEKQSQPSSGSANTSQQQQQQQQQQHIVSNSDATVLSLSQPISLSSQSNNTSVTNSHTDQNNNDTIPVQVNSYLKMLPTSTMLAEQDLLPSSVQLGNHPNSASHQVNHHGIVQYPSSNHQDTQFFISGDFPSYSLRDPATSPVMLNSSNVSNASSFQSTGSNNNGQHREEEQDKKRQMRLQKNREAAKECRRKKKEYIKCLEDRVNILAQQNKTLIEELKTLKKLYCQQNE